MITRDDLEHYLSPLLSQIEGQPCSSSAFHVLEGEELPRPYGQLLDHPDDMTSTLEGFFKDSIYIRALSSHRTADCYSRRVLLLLKEDNRRVEFGGIHIYLDAFPEEARKLILEEREPLGGIMNSLQIPYESKPRCFFGIDANQALRDVFPSVTNERLYGRCNKLVRPDGVVLARIVEILPTIEIER